MKILAYILMALLSINVLVEPLIFGKKREPYSYRTWIGSLIGFAIYLPICGRILGLW